MHSERIGKGSALDWGSSVSLNETDPPEIVIMIDADCRLADGAIDQLTSTCFTTGRPVQALPYLMTAPECVPRLTNKSLNLPGE